MIVIGRIYPGSIHNHTEYSNLRLRDSINTIPELINYAIELGHEVLAFTEHDSISNAIKIENYYNKIKKDNPNFKVILGNEIYLCRDGLNGQNFSKENGDKYFHFILLAKNAEGHKQIRQLSTRAWMRSYVSGKMRRVPTYYQDLIDIIGANPGNVIGSTACLGGFLGTKLLQYKETNDEEFYQKIINWLYQIRDIFGEGNFFLEMQPSKDKEQVYVNRQIIKLSQLTGIPYIITTDSHYLNLADAPLHEAFLKAQEGDREVSSFYQTTYLMGTEELESFMNDYFTEEQFEIAYQNIINIKNMCEDYSLKKELKIPSLKWKNANKLYSQEIYNKYFDLIPNLITFYNSDYDCDKHMVDLIIDKLESDKRLQYQESYDELNKNLDIVWVSSEVNKARWSAYFLNLQNILEVCWNAGTLVGPGRGSGVGFYLLYILDVIQINPLWETTRTFSWRFLNPERVSVLDIDTDIEGMRRADVLQALRQEYGEDRVANVITFGTEGSKSAIQTACLAPGTIINTSSGLKEIENITSFDLVYTNKGLNRVITPTSREYDGYLYNINASGMGKNFSITHNHQMLVYTNRTNEAYGNVCNYNRCQLIDPNNNVLGEFLSIREAARYYSEHYNGSYSSMTKYKAAKGFRIIELPKIQNHQIQWLCAEQIKESDYLLTPIYIKEEKKEQIFTLKREEQNPYKKSVNFIPENVLATKELAELIGIYLAEGNINTNLRGITFTINQKEDWLKERILYLLKYCFNIDSDNISILPKQSTQGLSIEVHSTPLGRWFNKYCQGTAKFKKVPEQFLATNKEIQKALIYGCFYGDGYARKRENECYEAKITSISYQLIQDLWQLAANNGYNCSILTEEHETQNKNTTYNLMFYGKTAQSLYESKYCQKLNYTWEEELPLVYENVKYYKVRINNIETTKYTGQVYCLETTEHNYLLNNVLSHNCRGLGVDNDIGLYISSLIPADRGKIRTLNQCYYGDEENDFKPIPLFVQQMNQYPELWKVAKRIEGLICRSGEHAGGVIFVDEDFCESTALMRVPNGDIVTQYDLHDDESVSLIKIDLLSVECLDKIHTCLDLLTEYKYIEPQATLKETYEKYLGIYNIERKDDKMWDMVNRHEIFSLFQMEKQSGIQGIALAQPRSVDDLAVLNSVIRLMAQDPGAEQPLNKYARFKKNIDLWYSEMQNYGLTQNEYHILEPIVGGSYGICESQEKFMSLVQLPECGGFNLTWADRLRKSIAKKNPAEYEQLTKEYFERVKEQNLSYNLCNYVWNVLIATSRGYGFKTHWNPI